MSVFAEENGLEVVLNWGLSGEGVLWFADYDITNALLDFMNDRYEPPAEKQNSEESAE